jgi:hypothetical protein
MPIFVVAAPSGGAGMAASQALAHAATAAGFPTLALDVRGERETPPGPALFPLLVVDPHAAPALIAEHGRAAVTVVHLQEPRVEWLRLLLPLADSVLVPGTRIGRDLDDAAGLYATISALEIRGASGRTLQPWLLPSGWACVKNPGVRLRGWRGQLERRTFPGGLHCLPMVFPWTGPESLRMASRAHVAAVGAGLLRHLAAIADGRAPVRPAAGFAGGDPWPELPPPAPVTHLPWVRPQFHQPQGA